MISLIDRSSKRKSRRISMERRKDDSSLSDGWSICRWFVEMRMRAERSYNRRAEAFASRARNDGSNERWSNERVQKEEERKKRRRAYSRLTQSHQREIYVLKFQGLIYECRGSKSLRGIAASIAPATNLFLFLAGYRVTPTHYPPLLSRGNNVLIQGDNGKITVHSLQERESLDRFDEDTLNTRTSFFSHTRHCIGQHDTLEINREVYFNKNSKSR